MSTHIGADFHTVNEEAVILSAIGILRRRFRDKPVFATPDAVKDFLRLQAQGLDHEVFAVMYLDIHNRMLGYEPLFRGSLTQTSVYPREVVKEALQVGASAVILHHKHPSGICTPSPADEHLTQTLKAALALVDVQVLDHIISSDLGVLSMRESHLI